MLTNELSICLIIYAKGLRNLKLREFLCFYFSPRLKLQTPQYKILSDTTLVCNELPELSDSIGL